MNELKESISIKNFGPLVDVKIEEIQPFTLIIGESASGKSTLMKVIALFRYIYKMNNIRIHLKNSNIRKAPFRISMDNLLGKSGLSSMATDQTEIEYTVSVGSESYTIIYKNKKLGSIKDMKNGDLSFNKISYISETRNIIPSWTAKSAKNRNADLGFYFNETLSDFDEATEKIKTVGIDFLDLAFDVKQDSNKNKKYVISSKNSKHKPIELKTASSGIQTVTPLLAIVEYFSNGFLFKDAFQRSVLNYLFESDSLKEFKPEMEMADFMKFIHVHIEEPELSLYPPAQLGLMENLIKAAFQDVKSDRKMSIMIATHSPYILNFINVFIKRYYCLKTGSAYLEPEKTAVYKIVDGRLQNLKAIDNSTGHVVINTIDLSETMNDIYEEYVSIQNGEEK